MGNPDYGQKRRFDDIQDYSERKARTKPAPKDILLATPWSYKHVKSLYNNWNRFPPPDYTPNHETMRLKYKFMTEAFTKLRPLFVKDLEDFHHMLHDLINIKRSLSPFVLIKNLLNGFHELSQWILKNLPRIDFIPQG